MIHEGEKMARMVTDFLARKVKSLLLLFFKRAVKDSGASQREICSQILKMRPTHLSSNGISWLTSGMVSTLHRALCALSAFSTPRTALASP